MHVFFSGIGGTAIGPLALIARQVGFDVSGSDKQSSPYIGYLKNNGITEIYVGQTKENIAQLHSRNPIDWFVYSSAITIEQPNAPELSFCKEQAIKMSKRDELLNFILHEKRLKLIAIAGTHGKTTTTAMIIWLCKRLGLPISCSVGTKYSFGDMGQFDAGSEYFAYEADEFDRNFLAFEPHLTVIAGVSWDHHEIFPTREDYQAAFRKFIGQSKHTLLWQRDADYLQIEETAAITTLPWKDSTDLIHLNGSCNRMDAWLACEAVRRLTGASRNELWHAINAFPGTQRRMEQLIPNLYTDCAHTPDKIRCAMSVALEIANNHSQPLIVVYEPMTNRRQHYIMYDYKDCFAGATKLYWIPSYLAREDHQKRIIAPKELISHLSDPSIARPAELSSELKHTIQDHLASGTMIVGMAGGGGLDQWLRENFLDY